MISVDVPNSTFQVSQLSGNVQTIVGFDVSLSQAEVPYSIVVGGPQTVSQTDLVVYGDTVTITEDLVNPGANITICARQIVIGKLAFISTAGADPVTDYPPDAPAEQTDESNGAPGANGAAGSPGQAAGQVVLAAESLQVQGPDTGAGTPGRTVCMKQLEAVVAAATAAALAPYQQGLGSAWIGLPDQSPPSMPGIQLSSVSFQCSGGVSMAGVQWDDSAGAFQVSIELQGAQFRCEANADIPSVYSGPLAAVTGTFNLTLTLFVTPSILPQVNQPTAYSVTDVELGWNMGNPLLQGYLPFVPTGPLPPLVQGLVENSLQSGSLNPIPGNLITAIGSGVSPSAWPTPSLVLLATGGRGGRGQDGHAGIIGATGSAGSSGGTGVPPAGPPGATGGPGGTGGQGGSAGTSGTGGPGGSVSLNLIQTPQSGIAGYANGGAGGVAAQAGAPGPGGPGGAGGSYTLPNLFYGPPTQEYAFSGPAGSAGPAAALQGAPGALGTAGGATFNGGSFFGQPGTYTYAQLADSLALYQLIFAQQAAKLAYLNAQSQTDYQNVIVLYQWLQHVTAPFSGNTTPANCSLTPTDVATRAAMWQAASLELARLSASLDYFGNPVNWVPVLTWNALNSFVTQQLSLAEIVQTQLTNAQQSSQQAQAAQAGVTAIQNSLANIASYESAVQADINALDNQITALDTQIGQQIVIVQQWLSVAQQEYVENQTGCSFSDVLNVFQSIASVASDVLQIYKNENAASVLGGLSNLIQGSQNLVAQTEPAEATYPAISAGWTALQSTLQTNGANSALILVEASDFETLLNQLYGGLAATPEVEDAVNELVNLVQTRNRALLNYTAQYTESQRLQAQSAQKSAELEHIAALASAQQQPQLPDYLAFLQGSLTEIATAIVDNLYRENQAFEYWSLTAQPFQVNGIDLGSLGTVASTLLTNVESLNGTGGPFQSFEGISYTVTSDAQPSAFARFAATDVLTVQVPTTATEFQGLYNVSAETMTVTLPGITPPAGTTTNPTMLQINITQHGPDVKQAVPPLGWPLTFTHAPRPLMFEYNYTTGTTTVGGNVGDPSQGYTGLSPFATWSLDFSSPLNTWLDRSQVRSVQLTFSGQALGPGTSSTSTVAIQTPSGNYVTAVNGGGMGDYDGFAVHTNATSISTWETFTLVSVGTGKVAFQTPSGNYLSAVNGGGMGDPDPTVLIASLPIHTNATTIGPWETFNLVPAS